MLPSLVQPCLYRAPNVVLLQLEVSCDGVLEVIVAEESHKLRKEGFMGEGEAGRTSKPGGGCASWSIIAC